MAKGQHLSKHQQGIVKNYYQNRDTLMFNKLSEMLSDLYVCNDEAKAARLWTKVRTALDGMNVTKSYADKLVDDRNLTALAQLLQERC